MKATFDDLPAGHWNEAQSIEAMRRVAIEAAERWAATLFLEVEECFAIDASTEIKDWGVAVAGAVMLNLVEQSEGLAAFLDLSPDESRKFIEDRVGVCRGRLNELAAAFSSRGHA